MSVSTMTASSAAQPALRFRRRGPTISVRKYGQNDFERFDEETARGSHLCVGSMSIGKVDIDVKYRWKEARWGVLGDDKSPGGVVYMDLTFKQPHGYWLESARVFVTLSEDSSTYALGKARRRDRVSSRIRNSINSDYDLQLTEHFGPQFLTGTKTVQTESKLNSFIPTIGAMGVAEIGGMGHSSATLKQRESRWIFKGTIRKPRDSDSFRTLEWELSENQLDPNQPHKQDYQTAFAFEHNYRPVFMRVEVEGKLRSKTQSAKHKVHHNFLRFSSNPNKKDCSTLTHIDLSENKGFQKSLDPVATSLNMAMEMKNGLNPPLEMPDPTQAHYFHAPNPNSAAQHQTHLGAPAQHQSQGNLTHTTSQQPPALEQRQEYQPLPLPTDTQSDPNIDSTLIRALRHRQATTSRRRTDLAAQVHLQEMRDESDPTSDSETDMQTTVGSSTLVNSEQPSFLRPELLPIPQDPAAEMVTNPVVRYVQGQPQKIADKIHKDTISELSAWLPVEHVPRTIGMIGGAVMGVVLNELLLMCRLKDFLLYRRWLATGLVVVVLMILALFALAVREKKTSLIKPTKSAPAETSEQEDKLLWRRVSEDMDLRKTPPSKRRLEGRLGRGTPEWE